MTVTSSIIKDTHDLPGWAVMWVLMLSLFGLGKLHAACQLWRHGHRAGSLGPFLFTWVGMNAAEWKLQRRFPTDEIVRGFNAALFFFTSGAVLLWGVARHFPNELAAGWCGMIGLVMMLHFGSFRGMAEFWRWRGKGVRPIMHQPLAAISLTEFWSHRWNRAFRDLIHPTVFQPACRKWGPNAALFASFLISGLLHEVVITVPAGSSYGLPTCYFLLQALGVRLERKLNLHSWWFTHAFTALPLGLAFPPAFVLGVMNPFFRFIGALP